MSNLLIYRASREDVEILTRMFAEAGFGTAESLFRHMYKSAFVIQRRMLSGNEFFYLARKGGEPVGAVALSRRPEHRVVAVAAVVAIPALRGTGVGAGLLDFAIQEARRMNCRKAYAHVPADNIPARILFTTREFLPEGLISDLYGRGTFGIAYSRKIGPDS